VRLRRAVSCERDRARRTVSSSSHNSSSQCTQTQLQSGLLWCLNARPLSVCGWPRVGRGRTGPACGKGCIKKERKRCDE
jgi:hypothetical protein